MTVVLEKSGWRARIARSDEDRRAAQQLRGLCFHGAGTDADRYDDACAHVMIEDPQGSLLGCYRMRVLRGADVAQSYSAQFYDVSALQGFAEPMVELGRFCIRPDTQSGADVLRMAWGAFTRYVDQHGIALLFGCSSFAGTDPAPYAPCFAWLAARHPAPQQWSPGRLAPETVAFPKVPQAKLETQAAQKMLPPLLRTYLLMGGWVSDHAVIDRHMSTLHVFTGVEVAAIPQSRKRLLRALAD